MSTYMRLQCEDHDPPIRSEDESGQHYSDLPRIREEIANRTYLVERLDAGELEYRDFYRDSDNYFPRISAKFLKVHPKCRIRIISEYGEDVTDCGCAIELCHEHVWGDTYINGIQKGM